MHRTTAQRVSIFVVGMLIGMGLLTQSDVRRPMQDSGCGAASAQLRTTLYFGLGRAKGAVSELEWQIFLRDEVTPRFPQGLTVWEAEGQWMTPRGIGRERTKVLLLVHPETTGAQEAVRAVIAHYRKAFEQESVLWETARVCTAP
jgi:hypothetical protein